MNRFALLFSGQSPRPACGSPFPGARLRYRARTLALSAALLPALALASAVRADQPPLSLPEAQRLAAVRSKQVEASDLAVSASQDLAVAAAERPDPVAKVGLENLPIDGAERFSDIAAAVPGLTDRMLSERLKELEAEGVVTRTVTAETPVRIEYRLTPKGRALGCVLDAIGAWAHAWSAEGDESKIPSPGGEGQGEGTPCVSGKS